MKYERKSLPLVGEGEALHQVGCRTKALNLIWFRGGGDLGDYFTASGGHLGYFLRKWEMIPKLNFTLPLNFWGLMVEWYL